MRTPLLLALLAAPAAATAHPHVFADSRIELLMDGPLVVAVRLTWTYDEFFSLLLTQDLGLDPDADAVLTAEELRTLNDSVTDWPPDFTGDLVLTHGEEPVPLAPREAHGVDVVEGRVVETHTRPLAAPVSAAEAAVLVENYDPYYYVAYTIAPEVPLTDAGACAATVIPADPVAGQAEVDRLYEGLDVAEAGPEVEMPPIGYAFTDRVEVRCDG
jgi:ABC-type uncharacterized transport system substrate-binding protein